MGEMAEYATDNYSWPDNDSYEPQPKTCRSCGKKNLHWEQRKVHALHPPVWRLCDARGIHHCKVNPPPEDK